MPKNVKFYCKLYVFDTKRIKLYVTFYTYAEAMAMEAACREADLGGHLVSIPIKLSAGCGVAWECTPEIRADIENLLREENIEFEEMAELSTG